MLILFYIYLAIADLAYANVYLQMRQSCSAKCIASVAQSSKDITMSPSGYEIKVVGGAVQKVPITVSPQNTVCIIY